MNSTSVIDPFTQSFSLTNQNGQPFAISMADIHFINLENIRMSLATGSGLGLSVLMLVTILLLTKSSKRQSPIFFLNTAAIILNTIACSVYAAYMTSNWNDPYALISADLSKVTRAEVANSIAYPVIKFTELIIIEASLILQVRVVLCTAQKSQRFLIMSLSVAISMVTLGFQCALMILNGIAIANAAESAPPRAIDDVANAANITLTISVCFFMVIFVAKLGYALKQRRSLGLRRFGPMQVIFIMGLQTMIVPAAFCFYQLFSQVDSRSLVTTLIAISLPLSSLWASASLEDHTDNKINKPKANLVGASADSSRGEKFVSKASTSTSAGSESCFSNPSSPKFSKDLEAQMH